MSLELNQGTVPNALWTKVHDYTEGGKTVVCVGEYEISLVDFLALAEYALTNTDLDHADDPRLRFVERVAKMKEVPGFNKGYKRLNLSA